MTNQQTATIENTDENLSQLTDKFINGKQKDQLQLIPKLIALREEGWQVLMKFLQTSDVNEVEGIKFLITCQTKSRLTSS